MQEMSIEEMSIEGTSLEGMSIDLRENIRDKEVEKGTETGENLTGNTVLAGKRIPTSSSVLLTAPMAMLLTHVAG